MWPAPSRTRGTATTDLAPRSISRSTAVSRSGSASSMKPQPTSSSGAAAATTSASVQYSATPAADRLPWPTTRRDGCSATVAFRQADQGVEGGRRHRAPALLADIGDRGQAAGPEPILGLGGADEPDRHAHHQGGREPAGPVQA